MPNCRFRSEPSDDARALFTNLMGCSERPIKRRLRGRVRSWPQADYFFFAAIARFEHPLCAACLAPVAQPRVPTELDRE
jgi:hypothetical protein